MSFASLTVHYRLAYGLCLILFIRVVTLTNLIQFVYSGLDGRVTFKIIHILATWLRLVYGGDNARHALIHRPHEPQRILSRVKGQYYYYHTLMLHIGIWIMLRPLKFSD
ncbi:hypothetical protein B0H19DRAFT_1073527 [Mycena capillaripes]|nr:hypothetical protein B0H19DRAFT_1073527 [Mycena capillaripes]